MAYKPVRVKFGGMPISGVPVRQLPSGEWLMTSAQKHPRFDVGHMFVATQAELIDQPEEENAVDS